MRRRDSKSAKIKRRKTVKRGNLAKTARQGSFKATAKETNAKQLTRERDQALEQLAATSDVLQVISRSPGELERVFKAILSKATDLCEASYGGMWLCEGNAFRVASHYGDFFPTE